MTAVVAGQSPYHKPTDYVPYQLLNDYKPIISAPIYKPTYPEYNPNAAYSYYKPTYNEPTYKPYIILSQQHIKSPSILSHHTNPILHLNFQSITHIQSNIN